MTQTWLAIIIVLSIIEIFTINLVTIWFVASGLVAFVLSFFIDSFLIQATVFIVLGLVLLFTTKKKLSNFLEKSKKPTNYDRIFQMTGVVTEDISNNNPGEVKVDGKRWTAISNNPIKKNSTVKILKIEGVKLIVEEVK